MGLLYPFPSSTDESEFYSAHTGQDFRQVELKSYGLPYIFWGYLAAFLVVLFAMMSLVHGPLSKLLSSEESWDRVLAMGTYAALILVPLTSLAMFFYQKFLRLLTYQNGERVLTIEHRLFFFPLWRKKIKLETQDVIDVIHFLDSPNMARLANKAELAAHQNRGYFELMLKRPGKKDLRLDRHSQKLELTKVRDLLLS